MKNVLVNPGNLKKIHVIMIIFLEKINDQKGYGSIFNHIILILTLKSP